MKFKKKTLAIVIGVLCSLPIFSVAQPILVQSYLRQDFRLSLNGDDVAYPEGLSPMIYQNRTYLPVSFISQILGADISFDQSTKTISILKDDENAELIEKIKNYEMEVESLNKKIEELETKIDNQQTRNLSRLPVRISKDGYEIEIEGLSVRNGGDGRLYISLRNNDVDTGAYISAIETTLTINGKSYKPQPTFEDSIDMDFYNWLSRGDNINSYLPFINLPDEKDIKEMKIEIQIVTNQFSPKTETLIFEVIND